MWWCDGKLSFLSSGDCGGDCGRRGNADGIRGGRAGGCVDFFELSFPCAFDDYPISFVTFSWISMFMWCLVHVLVEGEPELLWYPRGGNVLDQLELLKIAFLWTSSSYGFLLVFFAPIIVRSRPSLHKITQSN